MSSRVKNESPLPREFSEQRGDAPADSDEEVLVRAVLRLSGNILGLVLGIVFSLIIFAATNWLVLKGGDVVGPHLSLLGQYFIGYSVSFTGSLVGVLYGFVVGYLSGVLIAWVYNRVITLKAGNLR